MDNNQQHTSEVESIFSEEMHNLVQYEQATKGQRAVNLIIDNILMRFGLTYVTGTAVGYLLGSLFPEYTLRIVQDSDNLDLLLIGYIVAIFNYLIYYTICEKAFRGYTLGKLLTGTRAIRQDGGELTFKDAFLRSLSRLVPFEAFSGFGDSPWHDSWTKTTVVKSR
ncbi:MAG: RDD family protein [Chitinophagaceae bacterium]